MSQSKRATVYLDSDLHQALSRKAEATDRSISRVVNEAVRLALAEDAEDLNAFENRAQEPHLDFDKVVRSMRRRGKL
jgi:predicted transcriptional regulator